MSKSAAYTATAILATAILGLWFFTVQNAPPPTAALTLPASATKGESLVPALRQKPVLEMGEKTKLFMNNNAYLFGTSNSPTSAALSQGTTYRIGFGREIVSPSGNKLMGEVSFNTSDQLASAEGKEAAQTRLAAAYLRQITKQANFRARLSTDLAPRDTWSTLELQFSMELENDLSLKLNHDNGRSLASDAHEHQTGFALEKRF